MRRILLGILALLLLFGGAWVYMQYNKPHREASSEAPHASMSAEELYNAYTEDESLADSLWLDKVLAIKGTVRAYSTGQEPTLYMEAGNDLGLVVCTFSSNNVPKELPKAGDMVRVKGICAGYTMDVVLVRCELETP